jgi:hypothetical protein
MWLLARCFPVGREYEARAKLEQLGVFAWVPVLRKRIKPRYTRSPRIVELPLFGPYMFVLSDDVGRTRATLYERVKAVRFVSAGLERGLLILPDSDTVTLWRREEAGEFYAENIDLSKLREFKIGAAVLVVQLNDRRGVVTKRLPQSDGAG